MTLGEHSILGDNISVVNYSIVVELSTEDADEVKGWMPNGKLRKDVFALLQTYLDVDYDLSPHLTLPTRSLPRPRLGDRDLFSGYNIMLGLRDDNEEQMPETMCVRVGRVRKVELLTKKLSV